MVIGIDLGTTNSEVTIIRDGKLEVVEENGSALMPSCVGITPDGEFIVGAEARNQYVLYPEQTVRSIKRKMGSSDKITLGTKKYSPPEISAMILRGLKDRAERALKQKVTKAVITVPAYFNDTERLATREAGKMAGLEVLRIINEPTAAALAYEAAGVSNSKTVMVYDFGGGTFDVSIVKMTNDIVEVLASHGDSHLGGDDIDQLLFEYALTKFLDENDDNKLSNIGESRLRQACEKAKMELSFQASTTLAEIALPLESGESVTFSMELNRVELEDLILDLAKKTMTSVRHVMTESELNAKDINEILLVGGTTRIPMIADMIERELGKRPRVDLDPDLAVTYGAGVMAARLANMGDHRILVDISPYTFGTSCLGDVDGEYCPFLFVPIIKSGAPLPARRGKVFFTTAPGQEKVDVRIFQGDDKDARKNIFIGNFIIEDLDPEAPGGSEIILNMDLNLDGILTVTAVEQHTGLKKSVVIEDSLSKTSDKDMEKSRAKIAELFPENLFGDIDAHEEDADITNNDDLITDEDAELFKKIDLNRGKMDEVDLDDVEKEIEKLKSARRNGQQDAIISAREAIEDILFFSEQRE